MQRICEPEIMDDPKQVVAYAAADFSYTNQLFADTVAGLVNAESPRILDIGCGPGDLEIRLAKAIPDAVLTGVDGSQPMIDYSHRVAKDNGFNTSITFDCARLPDLPYSEVDFDIIVSKDLLHHLPDPMVLWNEIKRLAEPGILVAVMDLIRPDSKETAAQMVSDACGDEAQVLQDDFYNSLLAAFTMNEITGQLEKAELSLSVKPLGPRHFLVYGTL